jgi:ASC-1-like (ASCH) protein
MVLVLTSVYSVKGYMSNVEVEEFDDCHTGDIVSFEDGNDDDVFSVATSATFKDYLKRENIDLVESKDQLTTEGA